MLKARLPRTTPCPNTRVTSKHNIFQPERFCAPCKRMNESRVPPTKISKACDECKARKVRCVSMFNNYLTVSGKAELIFCVGAADTDSSACVNCLVRPTQLFIHFTTSNWFKDRGHSCHFSRKQKRVKPNQCHSRESINGKTTKLVHFIRYIVSYYSNNSRLYNYIWPLSEPFKKPRYRPKLRIRYSSKRATNSDGDCSCDCANAPAMAK